MVLILKPRSITCHVGGTKILTNRTAFLPEQIRLTLNSTFYFKREKVINHRRNQGVLRRVTTSRIPLLRFFFSFFFLLLDRSFLVKPGYNIMRKSSSHLLHFSTFSQFCAQCERCVRRNNVSMKAFDEKLNMIIIRIFIVHLVSPGVATSSYFFFTFARYIRLPSRVHRPFYSVVRRFIKRWTSPSFIIVEVSVETRVTNLVELSVPPSAPLLEHPPRRTRFINSCNKISKTGQRSGAVPMP